jgi:hypothetical protein
MHMNCIKIASTALALCLLCGCDSFRLYSANKHELAKTAKSSFTDAKLPSKCQSSLFTLRRPSHLLSENTNSAPRRSLRSPAFVPWGSASAALCRGALNVPEHALRSAPQFRSTLFPHCAIALPRA